jgi:hypothetical protein
MADAEATGQALHVLLCVIAADTVEAARIGKEVHVVVPELI